MIIVRRKNGTQTNDEQWMQSHMDSIHSPPTPPRTVDAIPHGLDPLSAQDAKDDHERVHEVGEVPTRFLRKMFGCVIDAEQLLSHHGEDKDDNSQDEAEVPQCAHRSSYDTDKQVQSGPRLGQLEYS